MAAVNITAIILAAGQSARFGQDNKLFTPYKGVPLIDHSLNLVLTADFADRIVVTGYQHKRLEAHIDRLPVRTVFNPGFADGMGASLAAGTKALNPSYDAFMVFLADMPDIPTALVGNLMNVYESNRSEKSIIRPVHKGKPGHPVVFAASHAPELQSLTQDQGAIEVIEKHETSTLNVEINSAVVMCDIDRATDLAP